MKWCDFVTGVLYLAIGFLLTFRPDISAIESIGLLTGILFLVAGLLDLFIFTIKSIAQKVRAERKILSHQQPNKY